MGGFGVGLGVGRAALLPRNCPTTGRVIGLGGTLLAIGLRMTGRLTIGLAGLLTIGRLAIGARPLMGGFLEAPLGAVAGGGGAGGGAGSATR